MHNEAFIIKNVQIIKDKTLWQLRIGMKMTALVKNY